MKRLAAIVLTVLGIVATAPAGAVLPDEILADPVLEQRAREISRDLRCLVCQNQSIDDSNAELAHDLRLVVRERLVAGDSDTQVLDYVVDRYGDFVLLDPPFKGTTLVLWGGPALIFAIGLTTLFVYFRRLRRAPPGAGPAPLSDADRRRVEVLLKDDAP